VSYGRFRELESQFVTVIDEDVLLAVPDSHGWSGPIDVQRSHRQSKRRSATNQCVS